MKDVKDKKPAFSRCKKFGVFIVDGKGLAVRCFDERKKAFNWIGKHWPELKPAEARTRVRTFGAYWQVRRFFDEQIQKGNTNSEVLALMTYYCGVSTKVGMDLKNGHTFKIAGEKAGASRA